MGKIASAVYENARSDPTRARLIGDGDGLYMRVWPHGTKSWVIELEFGEAAQNSPSAGIFATAHNARVFQIGYGTASNP